jgi:enoyl-CoA hydratase/carnithine racemase
MGRVGARRVILTDAGQRTFTVGADINDDLSAGPEVARVVNHALLKNDAYSKPIVAAVNGDCIGGGLELLLSTDIRAAVPEGRFGLPEVGDLSVRRPATTPIRSRIAGALRVS